MPVIVTEQYPRGLGDTVARGRASTLGDVDAPARRPRSRAVRADGFDLGGRDQALVCGIEAHVCVAQTVHDLLGGRRRGAGRRRRGRLAHRRRPRARACTAWSRPAPSSPSTEAALFELLGAAGTPGVQGRPGADQVSDTTPGYLLLEDGTRFDGELCGARRPTATGEVVFTTGDDAATRSRSPTRRFAGQIITFTYPHIGNYGVSAAGDGVRPRRTRARSIMREAVNREDAPDRRARLAGLAARLRRPGDHRRRHARARAPHPRRRARCAAASSRRDVARTRRASAIEAEPPMAGRDLAREVTPREHDRARRRATGPRIAAIDTGIKRSIVRNLVDRGARVELHPCTRHAPRSCSRATPTPSSSPTAPATRPRSTTSSRPCASSSASGPMFGICLGHQLLCRAVGLETFKLPFGHRGANHPVKDLRDRAGSRSPRRTTASRSSAPDGGRASSATSRCAGRPTSAPPSSRT